jgi:glycosyltransferase involved in cell wall biosynthesis
MRIGIVTSSFPTSPADTVTAGVFVRDLALELIELGNQVDVMTPNKYGKKDSPHLNVYYFPWLGGEKDLASASLRNPLTSLRYTSLVISGLLNVGRFARKQHMDALLAMWAIPSGLFAWFAWKQYGIPYGVWALGSDIWARHKYPFGDRIVRTVLRDAKFRFADGVQLAKEATQIAYTPCEFVPSVRRLPQIEEQQSIKLPRDGSNFLFIGRYEFNKGPDILIEAMQTLLDTGTRAHLHMFGVGSLESDLRRKIQGYEQFIHLGGYADPRMAITYMHACDWLVIPSRIESIPLVFGDAVQMRLPLIVTDVGDLGDLVRRFGVGKVAKAVEPQALAEVMQSAISCSPPEDDGFWDEAAQTFDLKKSAHRCAENLISTRRVSR